MEIQKHQDSQLERVGILHPSGRAHVTATVPWQGRLELLPRDCGWYQLKAITTTESSGATARKKIQKLCQLCKYSLPFVPASPKPIMAPDAPRYPGESYPRGDAH